MSRVSGTGHRGFTLIELLVVIAISGVLAVLLLPAVQKVRDVASRMELSSDLRPVGASLSDYADISDTLGGDFLRIVEGRIHDNAVDHDIADLADTGFGRHIEKGKVLIKDMEDLLPSVKKGDREILLDGIHAMRDLVQLFEAVHRKLHLLHVAPPTPIVPPGPRR